MSARSKMIATYALCGFSNPASIGITIASLSAMAPERRPDIAAVVLRAFVAGEVPVHGINSVFLNSVKNAKCFIIYLYIQ